MLSDRQIKILELLVKEYIDEAEPISSDLLKKRLNLDISPATIRNELQELTEKGYLIQPHTSAGRVPTEKGYRFFVTITFSEPVPALPDFIMRQLEETRHRIHRELQATKNLQENLLQTLHLLEQAEKTSDPETLLKILTILANHG